MKQIKLTKGKMAIVDDKDFDVLNKYKWHFKERGDCARTENHRTIRIHRQIMNAPENMEVDHINGNKLDNRRSNLRICTHSENCKNMTVCRDSKSGIKGVRNLGERYKTKPWMARIFPSGNAVYLGLFSNKEDASRAYDNAAKLYFGKFAKLNNI